MIIPKDLQELIDYLDKNNLTATIDTYKMESNGLQGFGIISPVNITISLSCLPNDFYDDMPDILDAANNILDDDNGKT